MCLKEGRGVEKVKRKGGWNKVFLKDGSYR